MIDFVRANAEYLDSGGVTFIVPASGTFTFWLYMNSFTTWSNVMGIESNFNLRFDGTGILESTLFRRSSKPTESSLFSTGILYHVAVSWTPGSGYVNSIYRDGTLDASDDQQSGSVTNDPIFLASAWYSGAELDGRLADFRIYNRVLSLKEIQTIYACRGNDGIRGGLINRWMMNEGVEGAAVSGAASVIDDVGALPLTPYNTPTYFGSPLKHTRRVA